MGRERDDDDRGRVSLHPLTKAFYLVTTVLLATIAILSYPMASIMLHQQGNMATIMDNTAKMTSVLAVRADNVGFLMDTLTDFNETAVTEWRNTIGEMLAQLGRPDIVTAVDAFIAFSTTTSTELAHSTTDLVRLLSSMRDLVRRITGTTTESDRRTTVSPGPDLGI